MALQSSCSNSLMHKSASPSAVSLSSFRLKQGRSLLTISDSNNSEKWKRTGLVCVRAVSRNSSSSSGGSGGGSSSSSSDAKKGGGGVPNSNYVVPLDKSFSSANSSCITRPLAEILRDLNKRIPDNIIVKTPSSNVPALASATPFIPWYHANRMLSFYAPGWCGEIRDVIFSDNGSVTVVYRLTIRGSDGEAFRESSGTISSSDSHIVDPVAAAEEIAFCRACARFGLGLYLYHEE
ncbi:DNA repair RAD52-like protein 2, chloroplastic [Humulus lupulus]|uniref:DNA repair RAD52-like protein 2, chloroplastic n=1 Tax=Humulus lupulus TaxID=3486 RepID=UPI002B40433C|nr:DNA repair RAD52-like protein 2, chloroplastic [Humulus lupulus]XP_062110804.1 DNA repair RAD52-like protein 2, chloroplastic [Humulus lupulus]